MTSPYRSRREFRHDQAARIGVLLVNLGTPDAPDTASVRRYLGEFLSDPRVVETPRWLWRLILHGVILRIRPARSARAYASVWRDDGSPLMVHSMAQCQALAGHLEAAYPGLYHVDLAMTYGRPAIGTAIEQALDNGVDRLLVLPLYPQYSATTTGAVFDAVTRTLQRERWLPELRFVSHYHDHPLYVASLVASVREHWRTHGRPDRLLMSFHGIPQRYFHAGDPYHCQCQATARAVATSLELADDAWQVSFQSRVGREPWLAPYTDETLRAWGEQRVGKVHVLCPGFASDCLETLEEIAVENRDIFHDAGGTDFGYIPALNARDDHIQLLASIASSNTSDWIEWARKERDDAADPPRERTRRARAMGAAQ